MTEQSVEKLRRIQAFLDGRVLDRATAEENLAMILQALGERQ